MNCHARPVPGPRLRCRIGWHLWQLNCFRMPCGPDHYHCFYCGKEADR